MNLIHERLKNINNTVTLYKSFDRYKLNTREELFSYVSQAYNYQQCKTFYGDRENPNLATSYISWAFLDKKYSEKFKKSGVIPRWKCGSYVWLVDVLSINDVQTIVEWGKKYFTNKLGTNKKVNYLRMDNNSNITKISHLNTQEFYG